MITMTVIAKAVPTVDAEGIVHCCAWCYPGASLVEAFPQFAGMKVSHGMCKPHLAAMWNDYCANEVKMARA